ncbi:MAG TPA: POTRA domain-containing protein, partial [Pseudobdellovibrionaceae bacterium]|nr:POTRA domain-containing protein [Pseudobdellovibrionaceae bacterium]
MTSDSRCRLPFWKLISTFVVGWMLLTSSIGGAANGNTSNQIWLVELKSIPKLYSEEFRNKFLENILKGFSEEDIDDAIVFLHSKSAVDQVKVYENEEGRIEFKVEIAPLVSSIEFKTDTGLSVPDLIYASGLVKDMSWRGSLEEDARQRLREYLTDLGFPDAQIEFSKDLHGDTVSLVVTVHEGDALVLKEIRFVSPNDILVEGLKRETKGYLDEPLSQRRLSDLQKEIRKYLAAKSYLQADLKQMKFLGAEKQKVLEVEISRPEKFQVEFKGNIQESRGSLEDHLALEEFQTTNPNIGLELVARTKQYYLNKGYARAEVNHSEIKVGEFDKKIVIEIDEGPKVKIENLVVLGVD